jgi:hypothetical protein
MLPFIGSEAIASGELTRGQLRWNYDPVAPDVYLPKNAHRGINTMARAAWLWSKRRGVISGRTAAALHGVRPAAEAFEAAGGSDAIRRQGRQIELTSTHGRSVPGILVRHAIIDPDEITSVADVPVTTPERTALDIARTLPRDDAVVLLDQLAAATGLHYPDVRALVQRYRRTRGIAGARAALQVMDAGARSPAETRVRLVLHDAGLPRPVTGIRMAHGFGVAAVGLGWPELRLSVSVRIPVADSHPSWDFRVGRRQDVLHHYEWIDVPVAPRESAYSIIHRVRLAWRDRRARKWR